MQIALMGIGRDAVKGRKANVPAVGLGGVANGSCGADSTRLLVSQSGPVPGHRIIRAATGRSEIHRQHRELQAGPPLEQDHRMAFGKCQEFGEQAQDLLMNPHIILASVAVFEDGQAGPRVVQQLLLRFFQNRQGQRSRPRVEAYFSHGLGVLRSRSAAASASSFVAVGPTEFVSS